MQNKINYFTNPRHTLFQSSAPIHTTIEATKQQLACIRLHLFIKPSTTTTPYYPQIIFTTRNIFLRENKYFRS